MLVAAAVADLALAALHAAIAAAGAPAAYRYFRAGEDHAAAAEAGEAWPARRTLAVAAVFAGWGVLTLAAAGVLGPPPPLARWAVGLVAAAYAARGLALLPQLAGARVFTAGQPVAARDLAFSAASLAMGLAHAASVGEVPRG